MYTEKGDLYISNNYQDFVGLSNIKDILIHIDSSKTYDNLTIRKVIVTTNNNYLELNILFFLPISESEEYDALYLLTVPSSGDVNDTLEFICNIPKELRSNVLYLCIDLYEENDELIVLCPKEEIDTVNGVSVTIDVYKKNNDAWEISDTFTSKIFIDV